MFRYIRCQCCISLLSRIFVGIMLYILSVCLFGKFRIWLLVDTNWPSGSNRYITNVVRLLFKYILLDTYCRRTTHPGAWVKKAHRTCSSLDLSSSSWSSIVVTSITIITKQSRAARANQNETNAYMCDRWLFSYRKKDTHTHCLVWWEQRQGRTRRENNSVDFVCSTHPTTFRYKTRSVRHSFTFLSCRHFPIWNQTNLINPPTNLTLATTSIA